MPSAPVELAPFSAPVAAWFDTTFAAPTAAQAQGWPAIAAGQHTLIAAPTGSGKTLAAFLWGIDQLVVPAPTEAAGDNSTSAHGSTNASRQSPASGTSLLYISPLRALATDVNKNLRAPLGGITLAAERAGAPVRAPTVGVRTGDTPASERARLIRRPPDILITTPESLYLMLTSKAAATLASVRWVIVDEIHSVAATKRGSHLALSLERLSEITDVDPQRIGLSATQRPVEEVAEFMGGWDASGARRAVTVVDVGRTKPLDLRVVVPLDDMGDLSNVVGDSAAAPRSIWPAIHPRLVELINEHRTTIVFVNARRMAERLASRLNELHATGVNRAAESTGWSVAGRHGEIIAEGDEKLDDVDADLAPLVRAHHGSLSRTQRLEIEDQLKTGQLKGIVATSSLELGIDMGAVDLVIQVDSPTSVASGLQRVGRAGHQVGEPSVGRMFPKHRGDLVQSAVVAARMVSGQIESIRYPRQPLDVLAQQVVAMTAVCDWATDDLLAVIRRAAPYRELSEAVFDQVLDLLDGRYPSEEFRELRPRISWDRTAGTIRARQGAGRLAVTNGGTIPDRGLYAVFTVDGSRVGELDEEMVYEARVGETFLLGASTWRIEEITHDRVVVSPAPGEPGKMPFWHADGPGRPLELGRAVGEFTRRTVDRIPAELPASDDEWRSCEPSLAGLLGELGRDCCLDELAARNLLTYLAEQRDATGVVPDDKTIVVERFRDEIGDWRVCILTPFGAQVHAPWGIALQSQLTASAEGSVELLWSDDGIVLRLGDVDGDGEAPDLAGPLGGPLAPSTGALGSLTNGAAGSRLALSELVALDPDEVRARVIEHLPSTALFASRFREVAGRALLLPRRRPGERTPLWQQRQRAAGLLEVAAKYPSFPMLLETSRECIQDHFDVDALAEVLRDVAARRIRVVGVNTPTASPMAQSLLFDWIATYMYSGDAPLAERRAAALSLDRELLADLLGAGELRELIDVDVLTEVEAQLQRLRTYDADTLYDALRRLGDLSEADIVTRFAAEATDGADQSAAVRLLDELREQRRAIEVRVAAAPRLIAVSDAARYRDALGCALPPGLPAAFTESDPDTLPLDELLARHAATHGPFTTTDAAARFDVTVDRAEDSLRRLEVAGRLVGGAFRPDGAGKEWCDAQVLRRLRRGSLARLRREVEPVDAAAYARFLPLWHGLDRPRRGVDAIADAATALQGAPIVASTLEPDVLAVRVRDYRPGDVDELLTSGELVWLGAGSLGPTDGRVRLFWRDELPTLAPDVSGLGAEPPGPVNPGDDDDATPDADRDGEAAELRDAIRTHLASHGAAFWEGLFAACVRARAGERPTSQQAVLTALYDLVWAGEITNDTLAPLRAAIGVRRSNRASTSARRRAGRGRTRMRQGRPGSLRSGPASAAGRWSLIAPLLVERPPDTARQLASATALLERHGVVTRGAVVAEGQPGGFGAIYRVLRAAEEQGRVRRGYFVEGLGGAQFASAAAVEQLRACRDELHAPAGGSSIGDPHAGDPLTGGPLTGDPPTGDPLTGGGDTGLARPKPARGSEPLVLAATDPAQPFGAALDWPETAGRPTRSAGAHVVLADGQALLFVERSGRSVHTFAATANPAWVPAVKDAIDAGRMRPLELEKIDSQPASAHPLHDWLLANGFTQSYRGPSLR